MADEEIVALSKRIHGHMQHLAEDQELYYTDIASDLGGEDELQQALLATAVVEGLIEPTAALIPIFQDIEAKLSEIVEP